MPEVSALAKEGIVFENFYTCQPVCGPARAIGARKLNSGAVHYVDDYLYDFDNDPYEK